jgi:hypothetical protein
MTRVAPARLLLNALGGLAIASAHLGKEATVEWSVREVWTARRSMVPRYELAQALLECAVALKTLRRDEDAERYRDAAHHIASAEGFHELAFRATELSRLSAVSPASLRRPAAAVAREVSALEPEQLPAHVAFDAAPA